MKEDVSKHMRRLDHQLKTDPDKFDHDFMNLKSYIEDLENAEEERKQKKSFALEQQPQQHELAKIRAKELKKLVDKYEIKINPEQELHFKQLIAMRSHQPNFYYEFKKKRTLMLKEKEPEKKEPFHVTFIRNLEREKAEEERKIAEAEARRLEREAEEFKKATGSNT